MPIFFRAHAESPASPAAPPRPALAKPALAVPARLLQASGDGRLDHPVEPGADRQDASPGRLGEHQAVRRIWPGRRHLHPPGARPARAGRDAGDDRHQCRLHRATSSESIDDPRLLAVTGSAADVETILADRGLGSADYILSGLPFSTLPPGVGEDIAEATANALRPGGAFLVYQFSPKVRDFIAPHFGRIERGFEWINVPPATLFWACKD